MRRRVALFSLLTAWLFATGSHWDLVQTFAWSRMFVGYARTLSLTDALAETFDSEKPCALCLAVSTAKQQKDPAAPPENRLREKIDLVYQPVPRFLAAVPASNRWLPRVGTPVSLDRSAPPVPPPRMLA